MDAEDLLRVRPRSPLYLGVPPAYRRPVPLHPDDGLVAEPDYLLAAHRRPMPRRVLVPVLLAALVVLAACSTEAERRYEAGLLLHEEGRLREAVAEYDEAIRLDPEYAVAYHQRGIAYAELGETRLAIKDYRDEIILNPRYAPAFVGRGMTAENV